MHFKVFISGFVISCRSYVVRPSVATGVICKVGAEVTCQVDPRMEESRAVWARDGGSCRGLSGIFPCLPELLCSISCWLQISWRPGTLRLTTHICPVPQLPKSSGP